MSRETRELVYLAAQEMGLGVAEWIDFALRRQARETLKDTKLDSSGIAAAPLEQIVSKLHDIEQRLSKVGEGKEEDLQLKKGSIFAKFGL